MKKENGIYFPPIYPIYLSNIVVQKLPKRKTRFNIPYCEGKLVNCVVDKYKSDFLSNSDFTIGNYTNSPMFLSFFRFVFFVSDRQKLRYKLFS